MRFVITIVVGAMLLTSGTSVADSGSNNVAATKTEATKIREQISKQSPDDISVTMAASVQEQINRLPPTRKKHIKEASKVGAYFMQMHLFGLACDWTSPYWDEDMGEVVAMGSQEWNDKVCSKIEPPEISGYEPNSRATRAMCPQVTLSAFQFKDGGVSLTYQMIKAGVIVLGTEYNAFISQGSGETEPIIVAVNANNRVYEMIPKDQNLEIVYSRKLNGMKWDVADTGEYLQHSDPSGELAPRGMVKVIGKSRELIKAKYDRYKMLIDKIEQQVAQVCK
jgi:hypothetical protein